MNGKISHTAGSITFNLYNFCIKSYSKKKEKFLILTHNTKNSVTNRQVLHQFPTTQTRTHFCSLTGDLIALKSMKNHSTIPIVHNY